MSTTPATNPRQSPLPTTASTPMLPPAATHAHPHSHAANAVARTLRTITLAVAAFRPLHCTPRAGAFRGAIMTAMSHIQRTLAAFSAGLALLLACTAAHAQCPPEGWLPGEGYCGADGTVYAMTMWDPDGDGPQTPKVIVGGSFTSICNVAAMNIAMYDPGTDTWSAMGAGLGEAIVNIEVHDLAVQPNGRLIAVGRFSSIDGMSAGSVARWTGSQWLPLGSGVHLNGGVASVNSVVALANGDVVVGGLFNTAGEVPAIGIARWDGDAWSALGSGISPGVGGVSNPQIHDIAIMPNGDLVVGGTFATAGGVSASRIASWNGTEWSALGVGVNGSTIDRLQVMPDGSMLVVGVFTSAGNIPALNVARWSQGAWSTWPGGLPPRYGNCLRLLPNGDLLSGGAGGLARWRAGTWLEEERNTGNTYAVIDLPNGDLIAGGSFTSFEGTGVNAIARRRGTQWTAMCNGINGSVNAMRVLPDGRVVAGGTFSRIDAHTANRLAVWDGTSWHPLDPALSTDSMSDIGDIEALPNGDIVVVGSFSLTNGQFIHGMAKWDGQSWSSLAGASGHRLAALAVLTNGDLVATDVHSVDYPAEGSVYNLGRWDGQTWHVIPGSFGPATTPSYFAYARTLAALPNGGFVIGGNFTSVNNLSQANGVAKWDGSSWSRLGNGLGITPYMPSETVVSALLGLRDGVRIVAGGLFRVPGYAQVGNVSMWNGYTWLPMGTGLNGKVTDFCELSNGDIIATGDDLSIPGNSTPIGIARWNGSQWLPVDGGLRGNTYINRGEALAVLPHGDFFVGGTFRTAGFFTSVNLARYVEPFSCCSADLDNGSMNGVRDHAVTIDDLLFFLTAFEAGDLAVDLDNGTFTGVHDGAVTIDDLLYFLVHFEQGC